MVAEILKKKTQATEVMDRELEELRVLGEGGQGRVTLCKDSTTGTFFALKTCLSHSGDEDLRNEFNSVRLLMDCGVNGIVPVHDVDMDDLGQLCILMDFCNGGSLLSVLQRRRCGRLEESEAAAVVRSLATTLMQCHSVGIMHRDIKPENVLVQCSSISSENKTKDKKRRQRTTEEEEAAGSGGKDDHGLEDGCCKLLLSDFGLAQMFRPGHHIRDGILAGTHQYMAPEMLKGCYDERADVWSLGVLLHLVLTGTFPPQSLEMVRLLRKGLVGVEEMDDEHVWKMDWSSPMYSHLSKGARSVLGGMLEKKPRHRLSLCEISKHPWIVRQEEDSKTSCNVAVGGRRKRIRGDEQNHHHHQLPPSEPQVHNNKPPPAAAPLVIRFRYQGNIIGGDGQNHHHHPVAAAAAKPPSEPQVHNNKPPSAMAAAAPLVIRFRYQGNIIREIRGGVCNGNIPAPLLPAAAC